MQINFNSGYDTTYEMFKPSPEFRAKVISAIKHLDNLLPFQVNVWEVSCHRIFTQLDVKTDHEFGYITPEMPLYGYIKITSPEVHPEDPDLTDEDYFEFYFLLRDIPEDICTPDSRNFLKKLITIDDLLAISSYQQLSPEDAKMIENIFTTSFEWFKMKDSAVDPDFNLDEGLLRSYIRTLI